MADADTAGTAACEVHAGASDAEGRGMDASDDFAVFERTASSELGAHGMVTDGPGEAATGGGGNAGAHAAAARVCATDGAAVDSGGGAGAEVADEGASSTAVRGMEEEAHSDGAFSSAFVAPAPAAGPKRRRGRSKQSRATQDKRKLLRKIEDFSAAPDRPAAGGVEPRRRTWRG